VSDNSKLARSERPSCWRLDMFVPFAMLGAIMSQPTMHATSLLWQSDQLSRSVFLRGDAISVFAHARRQREAESKSVADPALRVPQMLVRSPL
jgi:hypothetical protein